MKIVLAGNHNPCFFNSVQCREKAFRELGHEVVFFDTRGYFLPGRLRQASVVLQRWDEERKSRFLLELCYRHRPDFVLVIGGNISSSTVKELSRRGFLTVLWTTDVVVDPESFRLAAGCYDYVFCSGTEAVDFLGSGDTKIPSLWLPFACDPSLHKPVLISPSSGKKYARRISFVGSHYPVREAVLETLTEFQPGIWGPGWSKADKRSGLRSFLKECRLRHEEWRKIYSAADIVLVVHYQDGRTPCYQASPKLFEALACGAFVLCDDQKDARDLFKDGEHLLFFGSSVELREKIRYYLDRPADRQRIAAAGRAEVLARHTYQQRVEALLSRVLCGRNQVVE